MHEIVVGAARPRRGGDTVRIGIAFGYRAGQALVLDHHFQRLPGKRECVIVSLAAEQLGVVVNLPPEIDHGHDHS